jgi:hypothetical protein
VWTGSSARIEPDSRHFVTAKHANPVHVCNHRRTPSASAQLASEGTCDGVRFYISLSVPVYALTKSYSCVGLNSTLPDFTPRYGHLAHQFSRLFQVPSMAHMHNFVICVRRAIEFKHYVRVVIY